MTARRVTILLIAAVLVILLAVWLSSKPQAARDSSFALHYVQENAQTPQQQQAAVDAVGFKCSLLWAMLDALHYSYVNPGLIPPGAFVPQDHGAAMGGR